MNLLVIVVYNRLENIKHWLHCLEQCDLTTSAVEVVIIHTGPETYKIPDDTINYIHRPNIGYDIGALQDVCRERLRGFPNKWDKMLWVTDDTFPMATDFLNTFFSQLTGKVGCVAMEISPYVRRHVRTTGFAITKEVANRLEFPADPMTTKEQSYFFEHRSLNTMTAQIDRMGLQIIMAAPQATSPLFDTGYHRRLKHREAEHYKLFGRPEQPQPKVAFICPVYHNYPIIAHALLCQTYQNWELHLVHDGRWADDAPTIHDKRIKYTYTEPHRGNWGHAIRSEMLHRIQADYVVISNPDNYLVPVFIERMLAGFKSPRTVAVYCSSMVHSYKNWEVIRCHPARGYIDCSGVMLKLDAAKAVGWNDVTSHSADWVFFSDIIKKYGADKWVRVNGCLLIHN